MKPNSSNAEINPVVKCVADTIENLTQHNLAVEQERDAAVKRVEELELQQQYFRAAFRDFGGTLMRVALMLNDHAGIKLPSQLVTQVREIYSSLNVDPNTLACWHDCGSKASTSIERGCRDCDVRINYTKNGAPV